MTTAVVVYGAVVLISGLVVALAVAVDAWSDRRSEAAELAHRAAKAEDEHRAISAQRTKLLRELDQLSAHHADALRELGRTADDLARERHLRRTDTDLPRRIGREQERWADLIRRAVPVDRAGDHALTPAEDAALADLERQFGES